MTTGDKARISNIITAGILTENYSYDPEGRVSEFTQTVDGRTSYPMTTGYLYDSLDRTKEVRYPAQYGFTDNSGPIPVANPRKIIEPTYDTASRLTTLKVNGQQQAGDIVYNSSDQTESIKIGTAGTNQVTEKYTYDSMNGLLTNQKAIKNDQTVNQQTLLDLNYDYARNNSVGNANGKTGHLTKITDNLNTAKNKEYEYDALGRLTKAKGGTNNLWTQSYSYDRFGNRETVAVSGNGINNLPMQKDGISYSTDKQTNRITTAGYEYDVAGNQTRALAEDGVTWLKYEYDAANRLQVIRKDLDSSLMQSFQFGSSNQRLMDYDYLSGVFHIMGNGGAVEYTEFSSQVMTWTKSYVYIGDLVLSTATPNGNGGETTEFNHLDRLGTKLTTNQQIGTFSEQNSLPFGTALGSETSPNNNTKKFTSYERSARTGLDYAINRTYDSKLGRFTQVDPIKMGAVSLAAPQTLNLYSYCGNDPINHTDPDGLFWGSVGRWIKKNLKWIVAAVAVALAVVAVVMLPAFGPYTIKTILGLVSSLAGAASSVFDAAGLQTLGKIFGYIALAAGIAALGIEIKSAWDKLKTRPKTFGFGEDIFYPTTIHEQVTVRISFLDRVIRAGKNFGDALVDGYTFGLFGWIKNRIADVTGLEDLRPDYNSRAYNAGAITYGVVTIFVPVGGAIKGLKLAQIASRSGRTFGNSRILALSLKYYKGSHLGIIRKGVRIFDLGYHPLKAGGKNVLHWSWKNGVHRIIWRR